jgi:prepilin-type processing-associated H-X9-DG protein
VDENDNTFPGIASRLYGFQPSDWIYWRTNASLYPPFEKSPILTALPGGSRPSLRCPLDTSDVDRLNYNNDIYGPYFFSYSFNGYGLDANNRNLGMSSLIDASGRAPVAYLFKQAAVHNPSQKIMLAEEPGSSSSRDNPVAGGPPINDGRWVPGPPNVLTGNPLTLRHGGRAEVTFADGHVLPVTPDFGADTNNTLPGL